MDEESVIERLRQAGAMLRGHFVLSSGRHSDLYVEKFRAFEQPELANDLGQALAARLERIPVDVVLSPAVGAILLGFTTALALSARFVFAERDQGRLTLRRGFEIRPGERVLIVEDVITTGKSVAEVQELVSPGELVGIGCLVDRSVGEDEGVVALARLRAQDWEPEACPLCAAGKPGTSPGSRHLKVASD